MAAGGFMRYEAFNNGSFERLVREPDAVEVLPESKEIRLVNAQQVGGSNHLRHGFVGQTHGRHPRQHTGDVSVYLQALWSRREGRV